MELFVFGDIDLSFKVNKSVVLFEVSRRFFGGFDLFSYFIALIAKLDSLFKVVVRDCIINTSVNSKCVVVLS